MGGQVSLALPVQCSIKLLEARSSLWWGRPDPLDHRGNRETLDHTALKATQGSQALWVMKDLLALEGLLDPPEPQGQTDKGVTRALLGTRGLMDREVIGDLTG